MVIYKCKHNVYYPTPDKGCGLICGSRTAELNLLSHWSSLISAHVPPERNRERPNLFVNGTQLWSVEEGVIGRCKGQISPEREVER